MTNSEKEIPVEFKKQQVFIHPYLLGYWLFNQSNDFDVLSIKNAKVFKKLEKIINLIYPKLYLCYLVPLEDQQ